LFLYEARWIYSVTSHPIHNIIIIIIIIIIIGITSSSIDTVIEAHAELPDELGSNPDRGKNHSSQFLYRFWDPRSLLSNGYRGLFPSGKTDGAWTWTFNSSPSSECMEIYLRSSVSLRGMVLHLYPNVILQYAVCVDITSYLVLSGHVYISNPIHLITLLLYEGYRLWGL
jgi:hypothetical protein